MEHQWGLSKKYERGRSISYERVDLKVGTERARKLYPYSIRKGAIKFTVEDRRADRINNNTNNTFVVQYIYITSWQ